MSKIHVVTSGSYSDYHINAVFDNKEQAKSLVKLLRDGTGYDPARLETYNLNPKLPSFINPNLNIYDIAMFEDGVSYGNRTGLEYSDGDITTDFKPKFIKHWGFSGYPERRDQLVLSITVQAKNKTHAVKIVNEKRIQLIALGKWGVDDLSNL